MLFPVGLVSVTALAALGVASEPINALGGSGPINAFDGSDPINERVRRRARRRRPRVDSRGRDLADSAGAYAPVRIRVHYGDSALDELDGGAAFLRDELMPAVERRWAESPSARADGGGNLTLAPPCVTYWPDADGCVASCAFVAADDTAARGRRRVQQPRARPLRRATRCADGGSSGRDDARRARARDADFVLFVTAFETASCDGATLAYASNRLPLDRPAPATPTSACRRRGRALRRRRRDGAWADQFATGVHETAHALGFGGELRTSATRTAPRGRRATRAARRRGARSRARRARRRRSRGPRTRSSSRATCAAARSCTSSRPPCARSRAPSAATRPSAPSSRTSRRPGRQRVPGQPLGGAALARFGDGRGARHRHVAAHARVVRGRGPVPRQPLGAQPAWGTKRAARSRPTRA